MLGNRPLDVFIAKNPGGKMELSLLAANNAQAVLAAGISSTATSLTVNAGAGTLFPSPVAGTSFFKLTIIDAATGSLTEIVHVTARAGDVFTIQRAQEGTTARAWSANDIAANMMTAGTLSYILGNFQPLDPTLTALAALVGVANKLPYFNGNDTAALTDLTQVGRDIIGQTDIAAVLQYLGIVEATISQKGIVKLNGGVTNADDTLAATSGAVKIAYDLALSAYQASAISLGKGQLLQNMTSARVLGATYTNNTGCPIAVYIRVTGGTSSNIYVYVNNIEFGGGGSTASNVSIATAFFVVPPGATYRTTAPGVSLSVWSELR